MQVTQISENLSAAINYLEEILNNKDGETVIENIKKFKQSNKLDEIELI